MNLAEYQIAARKTVVFPVVHKLSYPTLGLMGELCEYLKSGGIDEAGDVLWYCAALCDAIEIDLKMGNDTPISVVHAGCSICQYVKKIIRDKADKKREIAEAVYSIVAFINYECGIHNMTLNHVLEHNIAKLADRMQRGVIGGSGDKR